MLVDSHCHLNYPPLRDDLENVIKRADELKTMLVVNTKLSEAKEVQGIAEKYNLWCSVGIHPHESQEDFLELSNFISHPKVVALGETGLDYYYDNSPRVRQQECFLHHIEMSKIFKLPLIIHTREADSDTIELLKNQDTKGVFHCFSGSKDLAQKALDLGFYISFSGIVTFKNAEELREVARYVPLDKILIETDAPYLAPVPYRGKPCEPWMVKEVAKKVAELKNIPFDEICSITSQNFYDLFLNVL